MRRAEPTPSTHGGPSGSPGLPRRVTAFLLGLGLMWACAFGLLPALKRLSAVGPTIDMLERRGIEAGAFWYAHVESVGVAERHIASLDLIHEPPGRAPGAARSP